MAGICHYFIGVAYRLLGQVVLIILMLSFLPSYWHGRKKTRLRTYVGWYNFRQGSFSLDLGPESDCRLERLSIEDMGAIASGIGTGLASWTPYLVETPLVRLRRRP
ncbi:hypothetical protein GGS20DRAFT_570486 [Poronia punctata]|nr:hypothetical protein GGS20DRAFT_570486 [Poronia punctata]